MATRTFRISLVGEPDSTEAALNALGALFEGEALDLLSSRLSGSGLQAQRLSGDAHEVVLFITPNATAQPVAQAAPEANATETLPADSTTMAHGGGGGMSSEEPP